MCVSMRCCTEGESTSMYHGVWLQRPIPRLACDTSLTLTHRSLRRSWCPHVIWLCTTVLYYFGIAVLEYLVARPTRSR